MSPAEDFMGPLKLKYLIQLRDRREEITGFLDCCEQGTLNEEIQAEMRRKTHRLAGSAATYGYPWISTAARALETAIDAQMDLPKLRELTRALLQEYDRALASRDLNGAGK